METDYTCAIEDNIQSIAMMNHALHYASLGWAVFPVYGVKDGQCACGNPGCPSPGKHPMAQRGHRDATMDRDQIAQWWIIFPDANIGIATGGISRLLVVDVDGAVGKENLEKLEAECDPLPRDLVVRTGSGGLHIYLALPHDIQVR